MTANPLTTVTLSDGWVVNYDYDVTSYGSPDSYWEQGDPAEFDIHTVWHDEYGDVTLSDDELDFVYDHLCQHWVDDRHDDWPEDAP